MGKWSVFRSGYDGEIIDCLGEKERKQLHPKSGITREVNERSEHERDEDSGGWRAGKVNQIVGLTSVTVT